ncbi:hypothetical protein EWM64_g8639 [Hericium alpestre]|uniref:Cleavage/polyadenylation specificity factor A subunit N-terminal domain-containing protein n=1 Tax=Hericium alpestre TaxID=135208 RepID=A0A4Y9ZKU7_9AGAM|nr:hypothetical protein EWM64_g8639 [Hericium alpestre]
MEAADYGSLGKNDSLWCRAFCMDPAADVVISVGFEHEDLDDEELETESINSRLTFYPRSLSSNGTRLHPLCQSETSGIIMGTYDARIMEPQIAGDMVGITVTNQEESIVIYNWHSGDLVVKMAPVSENPTWSIRDFTFLTSRSFVLSAELWDGLNYTEHALLLFTFCDESSDGAPFAVTAGVVQHIVTLLLPEVAEGQFPSGYINTAPCASYQPRGMPFKVDDTSRTLIYDGGDYRGQSSVRMVVHTDVFIKAKQPLSVRSNDMVKARQMPWDTWGPEYTRLFMVNTPDFIDLPQKPIHGERIIMQMTEAGEPTTYLMDFNRRAHCRQIASGDDSALITESSILPPSLFTKLITTSLPYTVVRIPDAHLFDGFLLDEQRLLGLRGSRPVQGLDVFVF